MTVPAPVVTAQPLTASAPNVLGVPTVPPRPGAAGPFQPPGALTIHCHDVVQAPAAPPFIVHDREISAIRAAPSLPQDELLTVSVAHGNRPVPPLPLHMFTSEEDSDSDSSGPVHQLHLSLSLYDCHIMSVVSLHRLQLCRLMQ